MFNFLRKKKSNYITDRKIGDLKISVIMPVYLGDYDGCADDREEKFKASVISFVHQTYKNKELIIVSDGCDIAERVYNTYLKYENVIFKKVSKKPLFSGLIRDVGVGMSTGDVICYLDSDDMLGSNHLQTIVSGFTNKETDYVYYNDLLLPPNQQIIPRTVELEHGSIGTSTIAHRTDISNLSWYGCDEYGHDWKFIQQLIGNNNVGKKIHGAEYYVCHIKNIF